MTARKLAAGVAEISTGKDINNVSVEDLLLYLPMRYEDRSSFARISDLSDGLEASLDLTVRVAKPRYIGRSRFIFTVSASDSTNTGPQVLIDWFVSGARAKQIIEFYSKKFVRGTRFIAFGKWQRDKLGVYCLKVNKPDELEVVSADDEDGDPLLAAIHVGRCVPVYRKINEVRPKQLREVIHRVLTALPETPAARFHAAELARDSLQASALAGRLFLEAASDTASLFTPKALIAAISLVPERRDSIMAVLDSRYAASPYTRALHGEASVAYVAAEDSLGRELGVPGESTRLTPMRTRSDVPVPGPRGPQLP